MTATLLLNQATLGPGTPGLARTDGVDAQLVTVASVGVATTHEARILQAPPEDAAAVLTPTGPATWTFTPAVGAIPAGGAAYRVELVTDRGLTSEDRQVLVFGIRDGNGLIVPPYGAASDPEANLADAADPQKLLAWIRRNEMNEADGAWPSGYPFGHWRELREIAQAAASAGGGTFQDALDAQGGSAVFVDSTNAARIQSNDFGDPVQALVLGGFTSSNRLECHDNGGLPNLTISSVGALTAEGALRTNEPGTPGAPSVNLGGGAGLYNDAVNQVKIATALADTARFAGGAATPQLFMQPGGSPTTHPGYSFEGLSGLGMALDGAKLLFRAGVGASADVFRAAYFSATSWARVELPDGTAAQPSIAGTTDPDTGLSFALNVLRASVGGVAKLTLEAARVVLGANVEPDIANTRNLGTPGTRWSGVFANDGDFADDVNVAGTLSLANGALATPSLALTADPDTGLVGADAISPGVEGLGLIVGGALGALVTNLSGGPQLHVPAGSLAIPSIALDNFGTGFYAPSGGTGAGVAEGGTATVQCWEWSASAADAPMIGFFGGAAAEQPGPYSTVNVTTDRTFDADTVAIAELADVVGTLIADLQSLGLIG